jgi:hypothetical protein
MPISSFVLQIVKHPFLRPLQYEPICTLHLVVRLLVRSWWHLMLNAKVCTTPCELCSFKPWTIIYKDSSGNTESEDYALQELDCYLLYDVYHWHYFHLLGEGGNGEEKKYVSSRCPGQHTHDVDVTAHVVKTLINFISILININQMVKLSSK